MFFAPPIINRIGGKNALLIAGMIMSARIIGSSLADSVTEVIILKTLHMFEVPFLLVGIFKYITTQLTLISPHRFICGGFASLSSCQPSACPTRQG